MIFSMVFALGLRGVLCYLTGRIESLMELVVNTQLNFGYECYPHSSSPSRSVEKAVEGADGIRRVTLSNEIVHGSGK